MKEDEHEGESLEIKSVIYRGHRIGRTIAYHEGKDPLFDPGGRQKCNLE